MSRLLVRLAASAGGVWLAVRWVDGLAWDGRWQSLLLIVAILAVVNAFVRPLAKLLSLPAIILSLGLFLLVINAFMLQIVVWVTGDEFTSTGFGATFLGALIISVIVGVATALVTDEDE